MKRIRRLPRGGVAVVTPTGISAPKKPRQPTVRARWLALAAEWPKDPKDLTPLMVHEAADLAGVQSILPGSAVGHLLPKWAALVKVLGGSSRGLHAIWDLRGKLRHPHVPLPRGAAQVKIGAADEVVDIGAYVGGFTMRAARCGAKVTAYEPTRLSAAVLALTAIEAGRLVTVVEAAVIGDHAPSPTFFAQPGTLGLSNGLAKQGKNALPQKVAIARFSQAVRHATVIKIDVEGAEYSYGLAPYPGVLPTSCRALLLSFHEAPGIDWRAEAVRIGATMAELGFSNPCPIDLARGASSLTAEGVWLR